MKKWPLILASALSFNLVSAQSQMQDQFERSIEFISPSMNGLANVLFGGSFTNNDWLAVAAIFTLIAVLLNTLFKRSAFLNEGRTARITLAVVATYFIMQNPMILNMAIGISNLIAVMIMAGSLLLLSWFLPKMTMSEGLLNRQAGHKERTKSRKEIKKEKANEKLNYVQEYLSAQEKQLEENEKKLEHAEDAELHNIINGLNQILQETEAEIVFKKYMAQAQKIAKTAGSNPLQVQQIETRYKQYEARLAEYEKQIHVTVDKLAQQVMMQGNNEEHEISFIDQEIADIDKELSAEKKIVKNDKKNLKSEAEEAGDKNIPDVKRVEEKGKAAKTIQLLNLENNKNVLLKEKKGLLNKKKSMKSGFKSKNQQLATYFQEVKVDTLTPEAKKGIINNMITIIDAKASINREVEQINGQMENNNDQIKQLEDQIIQLEQNIEAEALRTEVKTDA